MAAFLAAGTAVLGDWAGVELDGVGRRRMVLLDGLRDVCAGRSRLSSSGTWLLSADSGQRRRHPWHVVGIGGHDSDYCRDRSAGMAAGDRMGRQIQIRTGR